MKKEKKRLKSKQLARKFIVYSSYSRVYLAEEVLVESAFFLMLVNFYFEMI